MHSVSSSVLGDPRHRLPQIRTARTAWENTIDSGHGALVQVSFFLYPSIFSPMVFLHLTVFCQLMIEMNACSQRFQRSRDVRLLP